MFSSLEILQRWISLGLLFPPTGCHDIIPDALWMATRTKESRWSCHSFRSLSNRIWSMNAPVWCPRKTRIFSFCSVNWKTTDESNRSIIICKHIYPNIFDPVLSFLYNNRYRWQTTGKSIEIVCFLSICKREKMRPVIVWPVFGR